VGLRNVFILVDLFICIHRKEEVPLQAYGQSSKMISLSNSNLFNAMIYPFTRMVVHGAIWYQGNDVKI
jgi:hypothetical protein